MDRRKLYFEWKQQCQQTLRVYLTKEVSKRKKVSVITTTNVGDMTFVCLYLVVGVLAVPTHLLGYPPNIHPTAARVAP